MVEEGGIHKAARRLGLSQPPLSLALKELERELNCRLVFRRGRNWIVTESGRRLYEKGRILLARTEALGEEVSEAATECRGEVRAGFSTSCVFMSQYMLRVLAKDFPRMTCQLKFSDSSSLARDVHERHIEFAALYLPTREEVFDIIPLRDQRLIALFSELLPLPEEEIVTLEKLCEYPLLVPKRWHGGGIHAIVSRLFQSQGLKPRILCQTQASYLLKGMLREIPAVAILPQSEIESAQASRERQVREFRDMPLKPALVTLKNTYVPLAAQKMLEILAAEYGIRQAVRADGDMSAS